LSQGDGDREMVTVELHMSGPGRHQGHMCRCKIDIGDVGDVGEPLFGRRVGVSSGSFKEINGMISIGAEMESPLELVRDESHAS
jgi:hypothetical protein